MVLLDEFKVQDHEIDKHNQAHESNYRRFLGFPHVNGVDVGLKVVNGSETPQLAIRVFVTAKKHPSILSEEELIPKEVDGVLTDVIEGGPFVPLGLRVTPEQIAAMRNIHAAPSPLSSSSGSKDEVQPEAESAGVATPAEPSPHGFFSTINGILTWLSGSTEDPARYATLHGGIQIQTDTNVFNEVGTLGVPFLDKISRLHYLLTCAHVVRGLDLEDIPVGMKIMQNVMGDEGNLAGLFWKTTIDRTYNAATTDAALIALSAKRTADSNILGLGGAAGTKFTDTTTFAINDIVQKRGRTTGLTKGRVTGITAVGNIRFGKTKIVFTDLITIKPTDPTTSFASPGDSGAVIVNTAVQIGAMVIAGEGDLPNQITYACKIANVQAALGIEMYPVDTIFLDTIIIQ